MVLIGKPFGIVMGWIQQNPNNWDKQTPNMPFIFLVAISPEKSPIHQLNLSSYVLGSSHHFALLPSTSFHLYSPLISYSTSYTVPYSPYSPSPSSPHIDQYHPLAHTTLILTLFTPQRVPYTPPLVGFSSSQPVHPRNYQPIIVPPPPITLFALITLRR